MRIRLTAAAIAISAFSFALAGCELIPKDLIGTWTRTEGTNFITVVFEPKTVSFSQTDPVGSVSFSVDATDDEARHIDTTVTGATGAFSGYSVDDVYYWTYELKADGLYVFFSPVAYPPAATWGPFTAVP